MRMVVTLASQYYRLIEIPEALFGVIGSGMALIGLIVPQISLKMTDRFSPRFNLFSLAAITIAGLSGMALFKPVYGLIPAVILYSGIYLSGFFVSFYLNHITESDQRATVLSFKGLSFNLAYGLAGLLYAGLIAGLRPRIAETHTGLEATALENVVFIQSFQWFQWVFLAGFLVFLLFAARRLKSSDLHRQVWAKRRGGSRE